MVNIHFFMSKSTAKVNHIKEDIYYLKDLMEISREEILIS